MQTVKPSVANLSFGLQNKMNKTDLLKVSDDETFQLMSQLHGSLFPSSNKDINGENEFFELTVIPWTPQGPWGPGESITKVISLFIGEILNFH